MCHHKQFTTDTIIFCGVICVCLFILISMTYIYIILINEIYYCVNDLINFIIEKINIDFFDIKLFNNKYVNY